MLSPFQREFEENRNAELVETQRLQEQERRRRQEKVCELGQALGPWNFVVLLSRRGESNSKEMHY